MPYHVAKRSCMFRTTILFLVFLSAKPLLAQDTLSGSDKFALQFSGGAGFEIGNQFGIEEILGTQSSIREFIFDFSASLSWRKFRFGINTLVYTSSVLFDGKKDDFILFSDIAYRINREDAEVLFSPLIYFGARFGLSKDESRTEIFGPLLGMGFSLDKFWNKFGFFSRISFQRGIQTTARSGVFGGGPSILKYLNKTFVFRFGISYRFGK